MTNISAAYEEAPPEHIVCAGAVATKDDRVLLVRQAIADGSWTNRTGQGQGDLIGDPRFVSGWPTVNLDLLPDSPVIDAGDSAYCPAEDVAGNPRPADGNGDGEPICDVGAVEWAE
ncbi:MAG: choice-of-anchor Q domain-containing protein [Anaerolineales bacterium]|jgi:hypothetical protein